MIYRDIYDSYKQAFAKRKYDQMKIFFKIICFIIILYLIFLATFLFEEDYRKAIRYLFEFFSDNKLSFHMPKKHFHFASDEFIFSPCAFFILMFVFLKHETKKTIILKSILAFFIFPVSNLIFCILDSFGKLAECTACQDGTRILSYDEINYDLIFITSLTLSLLPVIIPKLIQSLKNKASL